VARSRPLGGILNNTENQLMPRVPAGEAYAVRAIGDSGLDVFCLTVTAPSPCRALESAMLTCGSGAASVARCWVVTRLRNTR